MDVEAAQQITLDERLTGLTWLTSDYTCQFGQSQSPPPKHSPSFERFPCPFHKLVLVLVKTGEERNDPPRDSSQCYVASRGKRKVPNMCTQKHTSTDCMGGNLITLCQSLLVFFSIFPFKTQNKLKKTTTTTTTTKKRVLFLWLASSWHTLAFWLWKIFFHHFIWEKWGNGSRYISY